MIHRQAEIEKWGEERGLYEQSNAEAQSVKLWEEYAETRKAVHAGDTEGVKDGIGDLLVVITHLAMFSGVDLQSQLPGVDFTHTQQMDSLATCLAQYPIIPARRLSQAVGDIEALAFRFGLTLADCIDHVLPIINARTGKFVNGIWLKDAK